MYNNLIYIHLLKERYYVQNWVNYDVSIRFTVVTLIDSNGTKFTSFLEKRLRNDLALSWIIISTHFSPCSYQKPICKLVNTLYFGAKCIQ